ncbi:BamA/TamA family outer membrane protein [Flammeovirga sp. MY04]|uniref:BamA/TamA family outer membrane protein n=1 Tax=Flammeovirga sp. MY04 TaxID=1191459 RepID=UPI000806087D|nr:BamA/TamA family outer membrane protein [Flammeovirga sp. MY04]ANQ47910.1 BamA/TamA family outer membrane protein [Flammeovirga sp. MY04]
MKLRKIKKTLFFILLLSLSVQVVSAQSTTALTDSTAQENIKKEKKKKNLRFSVLGGPGYTPDYGFLLGVSMLFTFKIDTTDPDLNRSVVPIAGAWLSSGGFNLIAKPQLFFKDDKIRYFGQVQYRNNYDNYYGVGFDTNQNIPRSDSTTQFFQNSIVNFGSVLFRLGESDFFLGPSFEVTYRNLSEISPLMATDSVYIEQGGKPEGMDFFNIGLGFEVSYDTRDIPANAWSGVFFDINARYYDTWLGSDSQWGFISAEYRQYKLLPFMGERRVLAWTAKIRSSYGDVPFTDMSLIGSPFDLRGYYLGQYRDKTSAFMMAEYRHMINSKSKLLSRLGFAAWGGVGMVGPDLWNPGGVLPNFGAGLRVEVQPRMNFRVDLGRDPLAGQNLIYFNMTEAF